MVFNKYMKCRLTDTHMTLIFRVLSAAISFMIVSLLIRDLSKEDFNNYAVTLSVLALLFWILDFGTSNLLIMLHGKSEQQKIRELLGTRFLIFSFIVTAGSVGAYFLAGFEIALMFFAFSLETSYESLNSFRQINSTNRQLLNNILIRRVAQITTLFILSHYSKLNLITTSTVYIISSFIFVFNDYIKYKPIFSKVNFSLYFGGRWIWVQSGGTSLANLDILILNNSTASHLIPSFIIGKKFSNALGIIGSVTSPHTLLLSSKSDPNLINQLKRVIKWTLFITLLSSLIFTFHDPLIQLIMGVKSDNANMWIIGTCLIIAPIGIINSNLNAMLIGLGSMKFVALSTYLSTLIYLMILLMVNFFKLSDIFVAVGIFANLLIEFILLVLGLLLINSRNHVNH